MVRVRTSEGLMVLSGRGPLENSFRKITMDAGAFRTVKAVNPDSQAFLANDEITMELALGHECFTIYLWKDSQVIFSNE